MFLLYDILGEAREKNSLGTVDSMFLLYDICREVNMRREVREMSSHGTVDSMFLLYDSIEVSVPNQESDLSYICFKGINLASFSVRF
jgi:hypothetical protein